MSSTIILGSGIIGVSTAYYLSEHQPPSTIHLVEPSSELFASASGLAAGFLAKNWFGPEASALGALSYDQHSKLAEAYSGRMKWGYSRSTSVSYTLPSQKLRSNRTGDQRPQDGPSRPDAAGVMTTDLAGKAPSWLRRQTGDEVELLGDDDTTAQVDPLKLCQFLLEECLDRGVQLHSPATAISVSTDLRNDLASVRIAANLSTGTDNVGTDVRETDIPCTRIVIAAGAWSARVFKTLFPESDLSLPISSLAGHSLVLKSPRWQTEMEESGCHALFAGTTAGFSPEIFSRLGGHLYIAGLNSPSTLLPELPTDRKIVSDSIARLRETAAELLGPSPGADDLEVVREGLCFRPITPWGNPIISRISDQHLGKNITTRPDADGGVFLAAGHGPWGITLSLGTGLVLAEMMQGRRLSADVGSLGLH